MPEDAMAEPIRADLSGKTCLVTGASAGIGKAAAEGLVRLGARVVMAVRDPAKGERARREIIGATGRGDVELAVVDLASQASVRAFASEAARRFPALDVLVNNAGVWLSRKAKSPDRVELTWATNVLGYHLATELLLPLLRRAPHARIVNVASQLAGSLDLDDVQFDHRPYDGREAYKQSKQADRMLTWALARRLAGTSITANSLHPGFVATEIFGKGGGLVGMAVSLYSMMRALPPAAGADTVVYLAASPEVEGRSGLYWSERQEKRCRFREEAQEEALAALCRSMAPA